MPIFFFTVNPLTSLLTSVFKLTALSSICVFFPEKKFNFHTEM